MPFINFQSEHDTLSGDDDGGRKQDIAIGTAAMSPFVRMSLQQGAKEQQQNGWRFLLLRCISFLVGILLVLSSARFYSTGSAIWPQQIIQPSMHVRTSSMSMDSSFPTLDGLLSYLHFAYAAFCRDGDLQNWTCEWCQQQNVSEFQVTSIVYNETTKTRGFVGFLPSQQLIVASFRGSDAGANWILDLKVGTTRDFYNVTIHKGWVQAYMALRDQLWKGLNEAHVKCPSCTTFVTTGHSLGAAIRYRTCTEGSVPNR